MDLGLDGKVALVTGAGSQIGFGKGIALILAREGCDIIVSDIDLDGAEQTVDEVKALGRKAIAVKADSTDRAEVDKMVKKALEEFGKIDILVNNAGGSTPPQPFAESDATKWEKDINLNLIGVMNCTRAVIPHMISRNRGDIVSISSDAGISGVPSGTSYGAAKAGVINFTISLAGEVADSGIKVNCIAPGFGATAFYTDFPSRFIEMGKDMETKKRANTPEDIGKIVAFLASDASIRIVGQCIRLSNMMSAR
ncbi:SDR family NAD(P)-dependent oxidoreductase [Chloroflexota bacterium]